MITNIKNGFEKALLGEQGLRCLFLFLERVLESSAVRGTVDLATNFIVFSGTEHV